MAAFIADGDTTAKDELYRNGDKEMSPVDTGVPSPITETDAKEGGSIKVVVGSRTPSEPYSETERREVEAEVGDSVAPNEVSVEGVTPRAPATTDAIAAAEEDDDNMCVVCLDAPPTHKFVPCEHVVTCKGCAQRLLNEGNQKCIVCRGFIENTEDPEGIPLERHYFSGLRSTLATQRDSTHEYSLLESTVVVVLYGLFAFNLVVCGISLWRARADRDDLEAVELMERLLFTGMGLSALPWLATILLSRTPQAIWYMICCGFFNVILTGGMFTVGVLLIWIDEIEVWMIFILFMLVPGAVMLGESCGLAAGQALLTTVSYWLLKSRVHLALTVSCIIAGIGFDLNIPLWLSLHCALRQTNLCGESTESRRVVGLMFFVYGIGVWIIAIIIGRVVAMKEIRAEEEEEEQRRAEAEDPVQDES